MTPAQAQAALSGVSIAEAIDALPSGHVRIETAFRYPDGRSIEGCSSRRKTSCIDA